MRSQNTIEAPHVTLGLVPEVLDAVDVIFLIDEEFEWLIQKCRRATHRAAV